MWSKNHTKEENSTDKEGELADSAHFITVLTAVGYTA